MPVYEELLPFHTILSVSRAGGVLVIEPRDTIFSERMRDIQTEYNRIYRLLDDFSPPRLIVDFHQVDYVDSILIGVLINLAKRAHACGGGFVVCSVSENVWRILGNLKLVENEDYDDRWEYVPTRRDAIRLLMDGAEPADS